MKNRLILFILFITVTIVHAQNTTPNKFNSKEKVGCIKFDKKRDNPKFHICDEFNIMEYYQVNPKYGEGYKSIRLYFDQYLKEIEKQINFESGLVTIRFVINCKGETDRFRVFSVDGNYKDLTITDELKQLCIRTVKNMGNWQPGFDSGEYFDSYFTLSLKIRNGQVTDLLP